MNQNIDFINFGGGFSPHLEKKEQLVDYSTVKKEIEQLIQKEFKDDKPLIAFESGRYLTAHSGTLIGKVEDLKISKGKSIAF